MTPQKERIVAVSARDLLAKPPEPQPAWIEAGVLPKNAKFLLGGGPKAGKTFINLELCETLCYGIPLFGLVKFKTEKARVLVIDGELGERGMYKRLHRRYLHTEAPENLHLVMKRPEIKLDTQTGLDYLQWLVDDYTPNVIILDPMQNLHTSDENSAQEMGRIFNYLDILLAHYSGEGLSLAMTHHFNKPSKDKDPLDFNNFRGSSRWSGWVDTIMTVDRGETFTHNNGHKWWQDAARIVVRHEEPLDDFTLNLNEGNDRRVIAQEAYIQVALETKVECPQLVEASPRFFTPAPTATQLRLGR